MKNKLQFYISLFSSKIYLSYLKILNKEQDDKPGFIAARIDKDFLKHIAKPKTIIVVTGTNGKTTVTNMLGDMLSNMGNIVSYNNWGANTKGGVIRCLLDKTNIFNKNKADIAVIEMDEISAEEILPDLKPNYLIVTDLYRDSMHRNAHPYFVFDRINNFIPKTTKLILNSDDPISSFLGKNNKKVYFGIDKLSTDTKECTNIINDFVLCPNCNKEVKYLYHRFHHLGKFYCPNCNYKSVDADYLISNLDLNKEKMVINNEYEFPLIGDNISNAYNLLTVITTLKEMGYDFEDIKNNIKNIKIVSSRENKTIVKDKEILTIMAKGMNAVATSRVCDYISKLSGDIQIIIVIDDTFDNKCGSEAISWIFDSDFELLNKDNIKRIIVGGVRNKDYILRLLLAGVPKEKLVGVLQEQETYKYIDYSNVDKIIIMHETYYVSGANKIKENIKKTILEEK